MFERSDPMKNGFIKVAAATPSIRIADPLYNAKELICLAQKAADNGVKVLTFPALSLTGSTAGDLFLQSALLDGAKEGLRSYLEGTRKLDMLSFVGMPLMCKNRLYNCAVACCRGEILGVVPAASGPCYGEYSNGRYFGVAPNVVGTVELFGESIPFGADMLFACTDIPELKIGVGIGADLFDGNTPSDVCTEAGATLVCALASSAELVGRREYRKQLLSVKSALTAGAFVYADCGNGESTTDLVFGGHNLIYECGTLLAEKAPFASAPEVLISEIDVEKIMFERRRINTYSTMEDGIYEIVPFHLNVCETALTRFVDPHPFVPENEEERESRAELILTIQAKGLAQRLEKAYAKAAVLGISGGLDSTLALLVIARAMEMLGRPMKDILAVTMPCFGTTSRTKTNATVLCEELGVTFRTVDIFDAVKQHFADIGHDPNVTDVTYENSQARERTQILMDIANECGGMVIGTGDLSELALGWATYNGDHMSMYGVNGGIPKTLIRHIVAHCANTANAKGETALAKALYDILDTPVSPELLPADDKGEIAQKTEDLVGPYELHDFYLYHMLRFGTSPKKLYHLAKYAFAGKYDDETLKKWLKVFIRRFFTQQFKRSCLPDGPKVGSVGLSPRGDWHMPSDASYALWMKKAEEL